VILDSSAIVAIYLREPGYERLRNAINQAEMVFVGAPTVFETAMVLSRHLGMDVHALLLALLADMGATIIPFTQKHAGAATDAFLRFGRGHHPAKLNFGDCLSYAVAAESGLPLLFKGDDFTLTDIACA
jgi:ribonuclease VapC